MENEKMKKLGIILVLTLVALVGLWIWVVIGPNQVSQDATKQKVFLKQSDDRGQVTVEVIPISLESGKEVRFKVVLDTHSVELSYDLLKASNLSDDRSNNFKPISWNGGSGGHHLNGELVFPSLAAKAKSAQLIIANISGFDRRFIWNL